jgi:hypothetical protein
MSKAIPLAAQAALSRFESARENLNSFAQRHAAIIKDYDMLRQVHNEALTHAKNVYREHYDNIGDRFGDFEARSRTDLDATKLISLLGSDSDALVRVEYKVDREKYLSAVKDGSIPAEVAQEVETTKLSIYGPKEI